MSEMRRLKRLERLEVMGARGAGAFYNLAELVSGYFDAPVAGISLLDRTQRWFYAGVGLDRSATPRAGSACEAALSCVTPLVFEDLDAARADGRVREDAFKEWRFYAAAPIAFDAAEIIGALFVADHTPRRLSENDISVLIAFSGLAVENFRLHESLLEQQRAAIDLHLQSEKLSRYNEVLSEAQQSIELASNVAKIGFWSKDLKSNRFAASDALQRLLLGAEGALFDENALVDAFAPSAREELRSRLDQAANADGKFDLNLPLADPRAVAVADADAEATGGRTRWARVTARSSKFGQGGRRLYGCVQDVTELFESRSKVSRIAMLDTLTGTYNRRFLPVAFMRKKRGVDAERERLMVMTVDLDNFKLVNDIYGHDVGDEVLVDVANVLREELRGDDVLARLGGDEFLVIASVSREDDAAARVAERLRAAANTQRLTRFATPVTFSIGYCDATAADADFPTALKRSDLAVYAAKRAGRDCCVGYDAEMGAASSRRSATMRDIERALADDEIEPFYQPKIALGAMRSVGAEVLARWRREDGVVLGPGAFFDALEDPRCGKLISERVISRALRDLGRMQGAEVACGRLAVNVTEQQMVDPGFCGWLALECEAHGVGLDSIEIEITERCLLSRAPDMVKRTLNEVRAQGGRIAFDDFGTGFASLTHLLEFPTDVIKIDMSFIRRIVSDPVARGICGSIIHLAKNLSMEVVAEGVEHAEEEELLREMGCEIVQGFLYAEPQPIESFVAFLSETGETEEAVA